MLSAGELPCYLGEINDSNKHLFTEGIREAFEFAQTNPDFTAPSKKDLAAIRQYDRRISQNVLGDLLRTDADVSLKEALSAVLASLPEKRSNDYVREHVQWVIAKFESLAEADYTMTKTGH